MRVRAPARGQQGVQLREQRRPSSAASPEAQWKRLYKERIQFGKPRWYALTSGDTRSVDAESGQGQGWAEWHGKIKCTFAWADVDAASAAGWG